MSTTEEAATKSYADLGKYWREQLDNYRELYKTWEGRGQKIVERYRDERDAAERQNSKFNILWSNVQVLKPSLYGRAAKPEVTRRYQDADTVGRIASTMLERVIDYEISQFPDFDESMNAVVEDRLLPGRGTTWIRFDAFDADGQPLSAQISDEEEAPNSISEAHAPIDYVYWKDFRHSPARTWDEVWWVARAVYMTLDEGFERFGDVFRGIPLSEYAADESKPRTDKSNSTSFSKKAKVWEIWDKRTATVCWIADDHSEALDERDDPLGLEEFFPCPKPLLATTTNGSLIPVPDFTEYQDQAMELDSITTRIDHLVDAVRAAGVYDGSEKSLARLLQSKGNVLLPVLNWGAFSEKGGLKGAMELVDLSTIVQALGVLYKARDTVIQTIYEVSGISDVQRGTTKAEETLGAQRLKVNFGSLRLRTSQTEVARFASDIFRLKAQIICKFYPAPLIVKMSGILMTRDGQDQSAVMQAAQLLASGSIRDWQIAIESDSLAQIDDAEEKAAATEAIVAIGKFMAEWLPAVGQMPQIVPMVSEMLLFLVRRYRAGRQLESVIEESMQQLQQAAMAPKGPSEAEVEAQLTQQADQMRIQADTQAAQMKEQFASVREKEKLASEAQLEQQKNQMEQQKAAFEAQLEAESEQRKIAHEQWKAELEAQTKLAIADKDNATKLEIADKQLQVKMVTTEVETQSAAEESDKQIAADAESQAADQQHETNMSETEMVAEGVSQESAQQHEAKIAELSLLPSLFDLGQSEPKAEKPKESAPEPAASEKKPTRFKIIRDENGRMSELVASE